VHTSKYKKIMEFRTLKSPKAKVHIGFILTTFSLTLDTSKKGKIRRKH